MGRADPVRLSVFAVVIVAKSAGAGTIRLPAPPPLPTIPQRVFNVERFGANPDGRIPATNAIQKAIHTATHDGGGVIYFPRGTFLCGPIRPGSHMALRLARGAVLKMLPYRQYPFAGGHYPDFIRASHLHDIAITGSGTITGQGAPWWKRYRRRPDGHVPHLPHRPQMIAMNDVTRLLIQGVHLQNPPNTHIQIQNACRNVTIRDITIHTPRHSPNTDGIDVSGHNIFITRCRISDGDDCIAIGGGGRQPQTYFESQNIVITHCRFGYGHGLSIGSFTSGGIRDLTVLDCTFDGTTAGIRLKSSVGRGGLVENLLYENIRMRHVRWPIFISSYYPHRPKNAWLLPATHLDRMTPIWRNIRIIHLIVTGSPVAGAICGLPGMPVDHVLLRNVTISADRGMTIYDAGGIRFFDSEIKVRRGPAIISHAASVSGIRTAP